MKIYLYLIRFEELLSQSCMLTSYDQIIRFVVVFQQQQQHMQVLTIILTSCHSLNRKTGTMRKAIPMQANGNIIAKKNRRFHTIANNVPKQLLLFKREKQHSVQSTSLPQHNIIRAIGEKISYAVRAKIQQQGLQTVSSSPLHPKRALESKWS